MLNFTLGFGVWGLVRDGWDGMRCMGVWLLGCSVVCLDLDLDLDGIYVSDLWELGVVNYVL